MGDDFLNTLAESTLKLTHINLTDCPNITAAGILAFTQAIAPQKVDIKMTKELWQRIDAMMTHSNNSQKALDP